MGDLVRFPEKPRELELGKSEFISRVGQLSLPIIKGNDGSRFKLGECRFYDDKDMEKLPPDIQNIVRHFVHTKLVVCQGSDFSSIEVSDSGYLSFIKVYTDHHWGGLEPMFYGIYNVPPLPLEYDPDTAPGREKTQRLALVLLELAEEKFGTTST